MSSPATHEDIQLEEVEYEENTYEDELEYCEPDHFIAQGVALLEKSDFSGLFLAAVNRIHIVCDFITMQMTFAPVGEKPTEEVKAFMESISSVDVVRHSIGRLKNDNIVATVVRLSPRHVVTARHILHNHLLVLDNIRIVEQERSTSELFSNKAYYLNAFDVVPKSYEISKTEQLKKLGLESSEKGPTEDYYLDTVADVAFIVAPGNARHCAIPTSKDIKLGDPIVVIGFPVRPKDLRKWADEQYAKPVQLDSLKTAFDYNGVRNYSIGKVIAVSRGLLAISASTMPGMSGAGVFDLAGNLIGLVLGGKKKRDDHNNALSVHHPAFIFYFIKVVFKDIDDQAHLLKLAPWIKRNVEFIASQFDQQSKEMIKVTALLDEVEQDKEVVTQATSTGRRCL